MNKIPILGVKLLILWIVLSACNEKKIQGINKIDYAQEPETLAYDSVKAAEYGADEYGMKK